MSRFSVSARAGRIRPVAPVNDGKVLMSAQNIMFHHHPKEWFGFRKGCLNEDEVRFSTAVLTYDVRWTIKVIWMKVGMNWWKSKDEFKSKNGNKFNERSSGWCPKLCMFPTPPLNGACHKVDGSFNEETHKSERIGKGNETKSAQLKAQWYPRCEYIWHKAVMYDLAIRADAPKESHTSY